MSSVRILLVEDEAPKCTHIKCFLEDLSSELNITIAGSVTSALDALEQEVPDLLILDMSLPTFDVKGRESGGRPQGFGGVEILRNMVMDEICCPTIIITGYDAFPREGGVTVDLAQVSAEWTEEFPQLIKGILHYNSTYDEWKTMLKKALTKSGVLPGGDK